MPDLAEFLPRCDKTVECKIGFGHFYPVQSTETDRHVRSPREFDDVVSAAAPEDPGRRNDWLTCHPALKASASRWRRNSPCMALSTPTKSSPVSVVWGPGSCAGRVFTIHSLSLIVNTCPSSLFRDTVPLSLFLYCSSPLLFCVAVHPQSCSPGLLESVIFFCHFLFPFP